MFYWIAAKRRGCITVITVITTYSEAQRYRSLEVKRVLETCWSKGMSVAFYATPVWFHATGAVL
jgi:hypothetical protein